MDYAKCKPPIHWRPGTVVLALLLVFPLTQSAARPDQKPDLSGLSTEERRSIDSAWSYEKLMVGPAAYYQCVAGNLSGLSAARTLTTSASQSRAESHVSSGTSEQIKKLAYFVGLWTLEGEMMSSELGPPGRFTGTHRNELASDGSSLISHWDERRPSGTESGTAVYSYDPVNNNYKYHGTSSEGETEDSIGTLQGDTWTWLSSLRLPSAGLARGRFVIKQILATSYDFHFEISSQNGEWTTVMKGKASKSK